MSDTLTVSLSEDKLKAFVCLSQDLPEGAPKPKLEDVLDALTKANVNYGIDRIAIRDFCKAPSKEPHLVALGEAAVAGEDARIEFPLLENLKKAREAEVRSKADMKEVGTHLSVSRGAVLAIKHSLKQPKAGRSVLGKEIDGGPAGKDIRLPASGRNTVLSQDALQLLAEVDGIVRHNPDKVEVEPLLLVKGDVAYKTGNISATTSVRITGGIAPGFTVRSKGDVEVSGDIENALIEAAGSVTVLGGVHAESKIQAGGQVEVFLIDSDSSIESAIKIKVNGSSLHSHLKAVGDIEVGKRVIGGTVRAGRMIMAESLGATTGTKTELEINPAWAEKQRRLLKAQLDKAAEQVNKLHAKSPKKIAMKIEDAHARAKEMYELFVSTLGDDSIRPEIRLKLGVHPGVEVKFPDLTHDFTEFIDAKRLNVVGGKVVVTT